MSGAGNYRYSHPSGLPVLLEELAVKLVRENAIADYKLALTLDPGNDLAKAGLKTLGVSP